MLGVTSGMLASGQRTLMKSLELSKKRILAACPGLSNLFHYSLIQKKKKKKVCEVQFTEVKPLFDG